MNLTVTVVSALSAGPGTRKPTASRGSDTPLARPGSGERFILEILAEHVTDDDLNEYLDPDLDPAPTDTEPELPGPLTPARIVTGAHIVTALLLTPFMWFAYNAGNFPQVGSLGLLFVLLVIAGVAAGRIAGRRFG